jgi:hypothetical protein
MAMYMTKDINAAPKQRTNIVPAFIDFSHHLQTLVLNSDELRQLPKLRRDNAMPRLSVVSDADGDLGFSSGNRLETATRPHRAIARFGGGPTTL